jgi:hypothetical protein
MQIVPNIEKDAEKDAQIPKKWKLGIAPLIYTLSPN